MSRGQAHWSRVQVIGPLDSPVRAAGRAGMALLPSTVAEAVTDLESGSVVWAAG